MTLKVEMRATLDAKGVKPGAAEVKRDIDAIGTAATKASRDNDQLANSIKKTEAAQKAAARAARAQAAAAQAAGTRAAKSTQLATHEVTNLSFQLNDIAVGLASGQSPFTVMAQQGAQVSQIMGPRGLGQILPALASGLVSMINPTTLLLGGITAVGFAASEVFSSMQDDVEDTSEVIERHDKLIRKIKDAYAEAGAGARRYGRVSRAVLEAGRLRSVDDQAEIVSREFDKFLDGIPFDNLQALGTATPLFGEIESSLNSFRTSLQNGTADIQALRDKLGELVISNDATKQQREFLNSLLDTSEGVEEAVLKLERLKSSIDDIAGVTARNAQRLATGANQFLEAFRDLEKIAKIDISAREQADKIRREKLEIAETFGQILLIEEGYQRALERIERQEASRGVPIPRERPNDIARLGEQFSFAPDFLQGQRDQLERLRLETLLIGRTNAERNRAIALLRIEQDIRRRGISTRSEEAEAMRTNALAIAEVTTELERQKKAWTEVQDVGTGAIDSILDAVTGGDFEDALEKIGTDLSKSLLNLGVGNPLKNALFRTDLPTISDAGGIGGFFSSLLGGGPANMQTGSMQVQAATVLVNGGLGGGLPFTGSVSPAGGNSVAGQIWNFFKGKGLRDHQVAGILGNVQAESQFDPMAVGDDGNAFGLFQWNDRRHRLFDFLGGRQNLGNIGGQLQFAWKELMSTEGRAFRNLLASTNVREATSAFGGFERPAGFSFANPEAMHNFTGRLKFAEDAMRTFGGQVTDSTGSLSLFGGGLNDAVSSLAVGSNSLSETATEFAGQSRGLVTSLTNGLRTFVDGIPAGGGGGGGSFFSNLFSGFFGGGGGGLSDYTAGLYMRGGFTGHGADADPAGVVHANEFVFDAKSTRAIGVPALEAIRRGAARGYQSGGFVTSGGAPLPMRGFFSGNDNGRPFGGTDIHIHNYAGVDIREEEESDAQGGRRVTLILEKMVGDAITRPGSEAQRSLTKGFGVQPRLTRR